MTTPTPEDIIPASAVDPDAPWWPVVVELENGGEIEDAIRGDDRHDAIANAWWCWPAALRITVGAEPIVEVEP